MIASGDLPRLVLGVRLPVAFEARQGITTSRAADDAVAPVVTALVPGHCIVRTGLEAPELAIVSTYGRAGTIVGQALTGTWNLLPHVGVTAGYDIPYGLEDWVKALIRPWTILSLEEYDARPDPGPPRTVSQSRDAAHIEGQNYRVGFGQNP